MAINPRDMQNGSKTVGVKAEKNRGMQMNGYLGSQSHTCNAITHLAGVILLNYNDSIDVPNGIILIAHTIGSIGLPYSRVLSYRRGAQ